MPGTAIRTGVVLAFAAIYLIWGTTYLAIAVVLRTVPPFASASLRTLVGGTLIYLWLRWRTPRPFAGLPLPRLIAAGMLLTGGGSGLTVWSQQRMPSGITALLISSVPLLVLLFNWIFFARRAPEPRALVGALVGLSGVALIVAHLPTLPGHVSTPYVIALLCAMLCWSVGTLVASGAVPAARVGAATCVQMAAGGAVLALLGLVNGDWSAFHPALVSRESWLALVYLTVFGSIVALSCFLWLLTQVSPQQATTYAFVNPLVALLLGAVFLGERVTTTVVVAMLLILAGVALVLYPGRTRS
jgi:drug/metabolite transporter (DMT)-like permease